MPFSSCWVSSASILVRNFLYRWSKCFFSVILINHYVSNVSPSSFPLLVSLCCLSFGIFGVVINVGLKKNGGAYACTCPLYLWDSFVLIVLSGEIPQMLYDQARLDNLVLIHVQRYLAFIMEISQIRKRLQLQ